VLLKGNFMNVNTFVEFAKNTAVGSVMILVMLSIAVTVEITGTAVVFTITAAGASLLFLAWLSGFLIRSAIRDRKRAREQAISCAINKLSNGNMN
jgi:hypothetical protein